MTFNALDDIDNRIEYARLLLDNYGKFTECLLFDLFNVSDSISVIRQKTKEVNDFFETNKEPELNYPFTLEERDNHQKKLEDYWSRYRDIEDKYETLWHTVDDYYEEFDRERREAINKCIEDLKEKDKNLFIEIIRENMISYFTKRPYY